MAENEIAESGIRRRAKQYEWARDLSEKIKAKADDIVRSVVHTKTTITEKTQLMQMPMKWFQFD